MHHQESAVSNNKHLNISTCLLSAFQETLLINYLWWFDNVVLLCMVCGGILLNLFTLSILSREKMRKIFFNQILICLTIFDFMYLLSGFFEALMSSGIKCIVLSKVYIYFLYPFRNIIFMCSLYTCVALTFERCNAITKPFHYRNRRTINNSKRIACNICPNYLSLYNLLHSEVF